MNKKLLLVPALVVLVAIGGTLYYFLVLTPPPQPLADGSAATQAGITEVVTANNQFALNLYSQLKSTDGNLSFSPYSLSSALAMTYEGAQGKTAQEMQTVFHFPTDTTTRQSSYAALYNLFNKTNQNYQLSTANALWVQNDYPFLKNYLTTIQRFYMGNATNVDFKNATETSRQTINNWVASKTNNKIKDLFPQGSLDTTTKLVLTNAIYFKGTWLKQFDKSKTSAMDFHVTPTQTVSVPMMQRTDEDTTFNYGVTTTAQILEMPYTGDNLSMLLILPTENNLSKFESSLTTTALVSLKAQLTNKHVFVYIPRFTFSTKYSLADTLSKMGMPTAFSDKADLSGMDGTQNLFIQKVIHQAYVAVDEQGTEAAAASGVSVGMKAIFAPTFKADHPFIFIIQDKNTGTILFMGRVTNPS